MNWGQLTPSHSSNTSSRICRAMHAWCCPLAGIRRSDCTSSGSPTRSPRSAPAFTEDETRELLAGSAINLSPEGVAALHQHTEGWAAGLRLAVISLTGHPKPERFVAEFSGT